MTYFRQASICSSKETATVLFIKIYITNEEKSFCTLHLPNLSRKRADLSIKLSTVFGCCLKKAHGSYRHITRRFRIWIVRFRMPIKRKSILSIFFQRKRALFWPLFIICSEIGWMRSRLLFAIVSFMS